MISFDAISRARSLISRSKIRQQKNLILHLGEKYNEELLSCQSFRWPCSSGTGNLDAARGRATSKILRYTFSGADIKDTYHFSDGCYLPRLTKCDAR